MMRFFLCFIAVALSSSCGSTYVDYDYDKKVDFSKYNTYAYDFDRITGFTEFDEKRFIKAIDSILVSKGWFFSETPDVLIAAQSKDYETKSRNTLGVGVGSGGGNIGVGVSGGIPLGGREQHRNLKVAIYDEKTNSAIWEALSASDLKIKATPKQKEIYFTKLVSKIFKKYPPER